MYFSGDLAETAAAAERKLIRLRRRIDDFVDAAGFGAEAGEPEPYAPVALHAAPLALDLRADGISTVIWATGFRRRYPWLELAALDASGELRHRGGISPLAGLYAIGLRFQRRRNSSFIDGAGGDAEALACHIAGHLDAVTHIAI